MCVLPSEEANGTFNQIQPLDSVRHPGQGEEGTYPGRAGGTGSNGRPFSGFGDTIFTQKQPLPSIGRVRGAFFNKEMIIMFNTFVQQF